MNNLLSKAALTIAFVSLFVPIFVPHVTIFSALLIALARTSSVRFKLAILTANTLNLLVMLPLWSLITSGGSFGKVYETNHFNMAILSVLTQVVIGVLVFLSYKKQKKMK